MATYEGRTGRSARVDELPGPATTVTEGLLPFPETNIYPLNATVSAPSLSWDEILDWNVALEEGATYSYQLVYSITTNVQEGCHLLISLGDLDNVTMTGQLTVHTDSVNFQRQQGCLAGTFTADSTARFRVFFGGGIGSPDLVGPQTAVAPIPGVISNTSTPLINSYLALTKIG